MFISGRNYFNNEDFKKMCKALDAGNEIEVGIDCIGHTRNNYEQEAYKEALSEKYKERLKVELCNGAYSYSYKYKLA